MHRSIAGRVQSRVARRKADILWAVAALVWAVAGSAAWALWSLERRWEALGERVARLEEEARRAGGRPHPRIREAAEDGDAWDAYLEAMEESRWRESTAWARLESYLAGWKVMKFPDADPANEDHWSAPPIPYEALRATSPALESLRRGVRRPARSPGPEVIPYPAEALGYLGIIESMRRFEEGLSEEGLEAALDVLQYAADLTWRGDVPALSRVGMKLAEFMLWQLKLQMESGTMDSGLALRFLQALIALEGSIPSLEQVLLPLLARHADSLASGKALESLRGTAIVWIHREPGWRHVWSWKALRLGTLGRLEGLTREYARVDRLPPAEAAEIERLTQEEAERSRTALSPEELRLAVGVGEDLDYPRFRALLRMLGAAARFHATGAPRPDAEEFRCTPELTWSPSDAFVARPWRVRPNR